MKIEEQLKDLAKKIVRLRDKDRPCIICGHKPIDPVCAHYIKQSQSVHLSYALSNIHIACAECNLLEELDSELHLMHRSNLEYLLTEEIVNDLEIQGKQIFKITKSEKKDLLMDYRKILKQL
jgi:hypothetical protein